jgi:predicted secreted Zn-dependent protease
MNATQVVVTLVALLALGGATVAVFELGGDSRPPAAQVPPGPAATSLSSPPAAPTEIPALPTPEGAQQPLPDRATCDEIRGTDYRSDSERDFFRTTCVTAPTPVTQLPSVNLPASPADTDAGCETSVAIESSRSDNSYDVAGTTLEEIADSLDANAPQLEGGPAFGLTEYSYGLDGSFCTTATSCNLGEITISADVVVTLPNLTTYDELGADLAQLWSDYFGQVAVHEDRHVRILEEGLDEVRRQLLLLGEEPGCDALDHEIDKVWALTAGQIEQRQRAFHIADAQGSGGLVVQ